MLRGFCCSLVAITGLVQASVLPLESRQSSSTAPPSTNPFYQPPAGWQSTAPGTILRSRVNPRNLSSSFTYGASYQLLYRTTDSLDNPTSTVTTIVIPKNPQFDKLLSYQIFYDSANVDCSPSYALTNPTALTIDTGLQRGLDQGWIVNTPDYEGPTAAFTAGVISGQATLDSIRAALSSTSITGISPSARNALWGYSGGALASEWAAELQPSYAPELQLAGVALGGLTPNVRTVASTINGGLLAGLLPSGVLGLASQYPDAAQTLNQVLKPLYASTFRAASKRCLPDQILAGAYQDYSNYFTGGLTALDLPASTRAIQAGGIMGLRGPPTGPLYVYKGVKDQVSPVSDTDALVTKYCNAGVKIQYARDANSDHLQEMSAGEAGAVQFLKNIMASGASAGTTNCGSNGIPS